MEKMKRNKPLNKSAFAAACAIACSTALAETISWYHFDEGEIGTKPAGATAVFVDSVTGVADGKAYAHIENQFKTDESAMPEFCEAFPNSAAWYDPVSKTVAKNDKCLRFLDPNGHWNLASVVTLADRQEYRNASLTIEAFVRAERDYTGNDWRFIIAKRGENDADGKQPFVWYMGINGASGKLFMYVRTKTTGEDGSITYEGTDNWCGNVSIRDGKWHHVAMVIDGDNKKILKYLDYVKQAEATYTGEITYGELADSRQVYVGKYWGSFGCFPGSIDEVRISSGVLTEKEFLRPNVGAKDCLPETVLYMPFEGLDSFGHFFGGSWRTNAMLLNQALPHETVTINSVMFSKDDDALVITNDAVNADFTRRDIASKVTTANITSLKTVACPTETKEVCPRITVNDKVGNVHSALTGSFTLELFAKINKPNALSGSRYIACLKGVSLPLYLTTKGELRYNPQWAGEIVGPDVCDDQWHHIAISYDRSTKTHSLYLDYKLLGSKTLDVELDASTTSGNNYIFGWDSDVEGGVSGLFDGIRLTTKVLVPQDFLTTRAIAAESYSLMLDFEESIETVTPYGDIIPAGVNAAMENGAQATLDNEVVTTLVREYNRGPERTNRKSLRLAGSKVVYPRNVMNEELGDQTIEFFLRGTSAAQNCGIIALEDNSGNPVWSFKANDGKLVLKVGDASYNLDASLTDGKWNHFALSFGKNESGTIAMNIYRNRTLMQTAEIPALRSYAMTKLVLGGGEGVFTGNIDEIRISPEVLSADELMQPYIKGTRVIVR